MRKLTILTLVTIFLTAVCISTIQPAKASTEEVATSVSITIQPENILPGQPFTVVVQINPRPPSNIDVFYNIFVIVTSAAQGISGFGPWSAGPSSSDANGVASFTFPGTVSATIGETGGGNIEVSFPGQYFGNITIIHYQAGDWQKNFFVTSAQTPTPTPSSTPTNTPTINPTITPTVPEFPSITILIVFLTAIALTLMVYSKKLRWKVFLYLHLYICLSLCAVLFTYGMVVGIGNWLVGIEVAVLVGLKFNLFNHH